MKAGRPVDWKRKFFHFKDVPLREVERTMPVPKEAEPVEVKIVRIKRGDDQPATPGARK